MRSAASARPGWRATMSDHATRVGHRVDEAGPQPVEEGHVGEARRGEGGGQLGEAHRLLVEPVLLRGCGLDQPGQLGERHQVALPDDRRDRGAEGDLTEEVADQVGLVTTQSAPVGSR